VKYSLRIVMRSGISSDCVESLTELAKSL